MINYLNTVIEISKERKKYFENYKHYAKLIKEAVDLADVEVLVFGSVVEGEYTLASDIDVLIISDDVPKKLDERAEMLGKIHNVLGHYHPFELHLVTKEESEWYKRLVKNYLKV